MYSTVCKVNVNSARRELQEHGTPDFPCGAYELHLDTGDEIAWHWHSEFEFDTVVSGGLEFSIPGERVLVGPGDSYAVNANVLHTARALEPSVVHAMVYSPSFVSGGMDTAIARRYIRPLMEGGFTGALISARGEAAAAALCRASFSAMASEPMGFELIVRESLSRLCLHLCGRFPGARPSRRDPDTERVQLMLSRIRESADGPLTLSDIAGAAGVGERECQRTFKRLLGITPKQYLIKYRVSQAAALLGDEPGKSIADIAAECGFNSSSVFSRTFRDYYGMTPREYRAINR